MRTEGGLKRYKDTIQNTNTQDNHLKMAVIKIFLKIQFIYEI